MKMRAKYFLISLLVAGFMSFYGSNQLWADTYVINPSDDGSLYLCQGCNPVTSTYVSTGGYIQGDVKFSTAAFPNSFSRALLSVNPYGLPLWGLNVDVYGFKSTSGLIATSDATAGTYLGTLILPPDLGFGQDAYFDVTAFLMGVDTPYVGFVLYTPPMHGDVFSSLEYNCGHPAQLTISTPVPEPGAITLLLLGLAGLIGFRRAARR